MMLKIFLLLLPVALAARPFSANGSEDSSLKAKFDAWANEHNKQYMNSNALGASEEYSIRFGIFSDNVKFIERLVSMGANQTWSMSSTGPFMDLTNEEFKTGFLGYKKTENSNELKQAGFKYANTQAADSVDWRTKGAVTNIKDQAQCGSCWSFSTTGSIEGVNFLSTGKLVSLSEQQLVSCDTKVDQGCNGGLMDNAFKYVIANGGITTEANYPYTSGGGRSGTCDTSKASDHAVTISGFEDVPQNDESALRQAISGQPVSVAVDATTWQFYGGGVFNGVFGHCGTTLDHGVLAVGYDQTASTPFYVVKNSWGSSWGEKGYIRLPTDKGKEGFCGIANSASYPTK